MPFESVLQYYTVADFLQGKDSPRTHIVRQTHREQVIFKGFLIFRQEFSPDVPSDITGNYYSIYALESGDLAIVDEDWQYDDEVGDFYVKFRAVYKITSAKELWNVGQKNSKGFYNYRVAISEMQRKIESLVGTSKDEIAKEFSVEL